MGLIKPTTGGGSGAPTSLAWSKVFDVSYNVTKGNGTEHTFDIGVDLRSYNEFFITFNIVSDGGFSAPFNFFVGNGSKPTHMIYQTSASRGSYLMSNMVVPIKNGNNYVLLTPDRITTETLTGAINKVRVASSDQNHYGTFYLSVYAR